MKSCGSQWGYGVVHIDGRKPNSIAAHDDNGAIDPKAKEVHFFRNGTIKLTIQQVQEIRLADSSVTSTSLAKKMGVVISTVCAIRNNKTRLNGYEGEDTFKAKSTACTSSMSAARSRDAEKVRAGIIQVGIG
jgi:hypothetical protein